MLELNQRSTPLAFSKDREYGSSHEDLHLERFKTRHEATAQLFDYIEVFYNRSRIHSAADYFAPAEYEARYYAQLKQAA